MNEIPYKAHISLKEIIIAILVACMLAAGVYYYLGVPSVYVSQKTGLCASVDSIDPLHDCGNLPDRYVSRTSY